MTLDVIACGLVVLFEWITICIIGILIQGVVFRITNISIYKFMKNSIEKEIAPAKVISPKNKIK